MKIFIQLQFVTVINIFGTYVGTYVCTDKHICMHITQIPKAQSACYAINTRIYQSHNKNKNKNNEKGEKIKT